MSRYNIRRVGSGVVIDTPKSRYALDKVPKNVGADLYLVSHAHTDHLPPSPNLKIIASKETIELARVRGYKYSLQDIDKYKDIEAIENGHILGSRAYLIDGKILYTGDINTFDREFLRGFKPPQADILIIESTYGIRRYVFGEYNKLVDRLVRTVYKSVINNINMVLEAYPLGKTQLLTNIFKNFKNLYVTKSIHKYNEAHKKLGYLEKCKYNVYGQTEVKEPILLIKSTNSRINKDKFGLKTKIMRLTGWMVGNEEKGLPLSDHTDYIGLLRIIDRVKPKKIYTVFGYAKRFAEDLNRLGYEAESLY